MNVASLLIAHAVLTLGGVRDAARVLGRPVSSVDAALLRLQSRIATPLIVSGKGRISLTLEGRRLAPHLKSAADCVVDLVRLSGGTADEDLEIRAARLSVSLLSLVRFMAVIGKGSIRAAAMDIGIGQPQLTRQMKTLETGLALDLFERSVHGVAPTGAGRELFRIAERLEAAWGRLTISAGDRFRRSDRMIRLGSIAPLGRESRVAQVLALLAAEWPKTEPRRPLFISSANSEELLAGLNDRTYDVALLETTEIPPHVDCASIFRSSLAIVGSAGLAAIRGRDVRSLLLTAPVALPSLGSGLRQKFEALVDDVLQPDERRRLRFVEVDSIPVIANLLLEHGYISLLPQWAVSGLRRVGAISLPPSHDIHLLLAWRRHSAAEEVARALQAILRRTMDHEPTKTISKA